MCGLDDVQIFGIKKYFWVIYNKLGHKKETNSECGCVKKYSEKKFFHKSRVDVRLIKATAILCAQVGGSNL